LKFYAFAEEYARADLTTGAPEWQKHLEIYIKLIIIASIDICIVVVFYFLLFPEDKLFISSIIFPKSKWTHNSSLRWWAFPVAAALNVSMCVIGWGLTLVLASFFVIAVFATIFVLEELRYRYSYS